MNAHILRPEPFREHLIDEVADCFPHPWRYIISDRIVIEGELCPYDKMDYSIIDSIRPVIVQDF